VCQPTGAAEPQPTARDQRCRAPAKRSPAPRPTGALVAGAGAPAQRGPHRYVRPRGRPRGEPRRPQRVLRGLRLGWPLAHRQQRPVLPPLARHRGHHDHRRHRRALAQQNRMGRHRRKQQQPQQLFRPRPAHQPRRRKDLGQRRPAREPAHRPHRAAPQCTQHRLGSRAGQPLLAQRSPGRVSDHRRRQHLEASGAAPTEAPPGA